MKKEKNQGITLVALIITIIILIILAGVTLNIALGENGIFQKSKEAVDTYRDSAEREKIELAVTDAILGQTSLAQALQGTGGSVGKNADGTYSVIFSETDTEYIVDENGTIQSFNKIEYAPEDVFIFYPETGAITGIKTDREKGFYYDRGFYLGTSTQLYIPKTINGLQVKSVAFYEYYDEDGNIQTDGLYIWEVEKIVIPEGVESIPDYGIYSAQNLKTVIIPKTVKSIGQCAFGIRNTICPDPYEEGIGAGSLKEVIIPEGAEIIGDIAFSGQYQLTTIYLPSTLTTISSNAFDNCKRLTKIYIAKEENSISGSPWGSTKYYYVRPGNWYDSTQTKQCDIIWGK